MKKMLCIQDLCSYGHCSLAVVLPIISCLKLQCVALPTLLLSTHTGGFLKPVIKNSDDFVIKACDHYLGSKLDFDAIYSGYLLDFQQIDNLIAVYDKFPNALRFVDPVMGDNGKAYANFDQIKINRMKNLIKYADIITPNPTELALLLDVEYQEIRTLSKYQELILKLYQLGAKKIVLTSAKLSTGYANICYDGDKFEVVNFEYLEGHFPGTGDIFASVLFGCYLKGYDLITSCKFASNYVSLCITQTIKNNYDPKEGLQFEKCLDYLCNIGG